MDMASIKTRFHAILNMSGYSQRRLSQETGIASSNLSAYLNNTERDIGFFTMATFARLVGFSLDWLAGLPRREKDAALEPDLERIIEVYRGLHYDHNRALAQRQLESIAEADTEQRASLGNSRL